MKSTRRGSFSVDPAQAILVGDSLTSDILGGKNAGVRTCWFNPHHRTQNAAVTPDYEIDALDQLPPLLKTL